MARSILLENLPPSLLAKLSTTCSNATEVAWWGALVCRLPQPAIDNGVRDGRSNWLPLPPTIHRAIPPELHLQAGPQITRLSVLSVLVQWDKNARPSECQATALHVRPLHCMCGNCTACAATALPVQPPHCLCGHRTACAATALPVLPLHCPCCHCTAYAATALPVRPLHCLCGHGRSKISTWSKIINKKRVFDAFRITPYRI